MIMKCDCKNDPQDEVHGTGRRVHNKTEKGKSGPPIYRCTVCGKERPGKV